MKQRRSWGGADGLGPGLPKHEHPDEGPNGGVLVEWGEEEYHPEFKPDHAKKLATVWIHDGRIKPTAIDAKTIQLTISNVEPPLNITLTADPQEKDPKGKSSRFSGTHDVLAKEMEFKGTISGKVGGTPYSGKFEEKPHDHKKEKKDKK
jgi:hypothetical protein